MRMRFALGVLAAVASAYSVGCTPVRHNLPPAERLMEPGPGVGGPGPGVLAPETIPVGAAGMGMGAPYRMPMAQLEFRQPESMQILYDAVGDGTFTSEPLVVPARKEFQQGGIFRLKLTNIQGREGVELYPTVEVAPATPRTAAYLEHSSIPIQFTEEDFEQVLSGNFVTKVLYLPDPEFQGDALAGVDTIVSTRLDPGVDPIIEADRRGSILAVIRLGNKDIELSGPGAGGALAGGMMGPGGPMMGACGPDGMPIGGVPYSLPGMVAGVTAPEYGMTYSGTPIGLPGPPHIPLGTPAGLQRHTIKNHTPMHIPDPVEHMKIHVRQTPGYSYPQPASRVRIHEQNINPGMSYGQPWARHTSQQVGSGVNASGAAYCPPGQ